MPTPLIRWLCACLACLAAWGSAAADEWAPVRKSPAAASESDSQARVIVKYRSEGTLMRQQAAAGDARARQPQHAATLSQRLGITLSDGRVLGQRSQVLRAQGLSSSALAARLANDSDVEYAIPDQRRHVLGVPNDPLYPDGQAATPAVGQWYLRAPASPARAAINAEAAWNVTTGSSAVTVAVVDTGVRFDHPDLAGKLYAGHDFISDSTIANDGDGRDNDASDPGDWLTQGEKDSDPSDFKDCTVESSSWHGTQVSGLIGAATNNGIGIASVGNQVMILPVRVLGKCGGFDSDIIAGMQWAAGLSSDTSLPANPHPAQVINLSLGSQDSCSQAYIDVMAQLAAASVTVVAAAGNDEGLAVSMPANCPNVIAVAGVRHSGTKVGYSDIGPQVALSAPAGNCVNLTGTCLYPIVTTTNSGTTVPAANTYSDGNSDPSLGTSFSAPLVPGTAALMLSLNPSIPPGRIKSLLQASARAFPTTGAGAGTVTACHAPNGSAQDECYCTTTTCGAGLLDASAAVQAVISAALPTAKISASATSVTVGGTLTLDGSASTAGDGTSITSYAWSLGESSLASFSGANDAAKATVLATQAGSELVTLTVTDSRGITASTSVSLSIAAAASGGAASTTVSPVASAGTNSGSSSGGGGGGALGWGWLLGLFVAVIVLRLQQRRGRRRP